MQTSSKENILKKIRKSLISKQPEIFPGLDFKSNVYNLPPVADGPGLDVLFAEQFTEASGNFIYCENEM